MSITNKTNVLVVGGGFAGVKTALELSKSRACAVTLVSDHSHFRYYPALYHTATGGRRAGSRIRLNTILEGRNVQFIRAAVKNIDRDKKEVITADSQHIPFDIVVLGLGNVTNYFGIAGLPEYSYGIKSSEEVERFKKHLHEQMATDKAPDLNYVIVGGGPTGIELAGALPSYLKDVMRRHNIPPAELHITLIEAAPTLLPRSPKKISGAVTKRLQKLGVTIMTGTAVGGQTADTLMAGTTPLKTRTVVWTAGVTNNPFFKENNFKLTDRGKVEVDEFLQAEPGIYVVGDNANTPFSGMAQTALYDGDFVAHNILRALVGKTPKAYEPEKPISVIPVGEHWSAVEWGKMAFTGLVGGWLHIFVDLIAFHDIESWPRASAQWIRSKEESDEDICPDCASKQ